jgi:hypothetical protein
MSQATPKIHNTAPSLLPNINTSASMKPTIAARNTKLLTLGKYDPLHFDITLHQLPENVMAKQQNLQLFNMADTISDIFKCKYKLLGPSPWSFASTQEAAIANTNRLRLLKFNVEQATQSPTDTIVSYGSEFRLTHILEPLLHRHPN